MKSVFHGMVGKTSGRIMWDGRGKEEAVSENNTLTSRSGQIKDWVGKQFGDLSVINYDGKRDGKHYWRCRCSCGGEAVVCQSNLKSGHTRSCGCRVSPSATRHFVQGTCIESIKSRKVSARNSSGIRGVYRNKRNGRWVAQITFQGKTRYLGSFAEIQEAAEARSVAEAVFDQFLREYEDKSFEIAAEKEACRDTKQRRNII